MHSPHVPGLVAVTVAVLASTSPPAGADCAAIPMKAAELTAEVIGLGTYIDLAGTPAAFFLEPATGRVLGPIDGPGVPVVSPGQPGTLTFRALVVDPPMAGSPAPTVGFFRRFTAHGAASSLDPVIARVSDSFVLGLLAGASPVETTAAARMATLGATNSDGSSLAQAMQGVLYAAPRARAETLFRGYSNEAYFGVDPGWLVALKHEGLVGVARRVPTAHRTWADYLPALVIAWRNHPRSLDAALDTAALGEELLPDPVFETDTDPVNPFRRGCGPTREQIHGAFQGAGELGRRTAMTLLARVDAKFAAAVRAAVRGVTALPAVTVIDVSARGSRRQVLVGDDAGELTMVVLDARQVSGLARGSRLAFVARRPRGADETVPVSHLAPNESAIMAAGRATAVRAGGSDAAALVAAMRAGVQSGSTASSAGPALATAFDLIGATPAWTLPAFRAAIWSLPGNQYDTAKEWAGAWHEIVEAALQFSTNPAFADEVEHALPTIVQVFGRTGTRSGKRQVAIDGDAVRTFAMQVAAPLALLRVRTGDLAGADRILTLAAGPLSAIAGAGVRLGAETQPANYAADDVRVLHVMVRGLQQRSAADVRSRNPDVITSDGYAFASATRPYAASLRKSWAAALVAGGYPRPSLDD